MSAFRLTITCLASRDLIDTPLEKDVPSIPNVFEKLMSVDLERFRLHYLWQIPGSVFFDSESIVLKLRSDTVHLDLSGNSLQGTIPAELADLLDIKTAFVDLRGNRLTGSLPERLCPWLCGDSVTESQTLRVDCNQVRCDCDC